jgi:hypothetical protein
MDRKIGSRITTEERDVAVYKVLALIFLEGVGKITKTLNQHSFFPS